VSARDGITLWTHTFDRELKDIFAVQQEIARAVAQSLQVTLLGTENSSTQMATTSVEAHNAYLQGHFHFRRSNIEAFRKAITYFDRAIELDPNYAAVYAERAEVWTLLGDQTGQRTTLYPKARIDADKAVALAPSLAEAHAALGWVQCFTEWNFAEGLPQLEKAKMLAPANPTANDLLGRIVVYLGRVDEAERQAGRQWNSTHYLCDAVQSRSRSVHAGKLDEADACGRKVAEIQPTASSSHRWQVLVAVERNDGEGALREAELEPDMAFSTFRAYARSLHPRRAGGGGRDLGGADRPRP
jgi:serine/threonine-protein kinase